MLSATVEATGMKRSEYDTNLYRAGLGLAALVIAVALVWYALAALELGLVDFVPAVSAGERFNRIANGATQGALAQLAIMLVGVLLWAWLQRAGSHGWQSAMIVGFCLTTGAALLYFGVEIYLISQSQKVERLLLDGIPIGVAQAVMAGVMSACVSLVAWRVAFFRRANHQH